ncbi:MAG: hypothetical protein K2H46_08630, partial [Muribaculaceae bacterium]|nr:hypothetical protein [Muribaculaceae bacterium]
IYTQHVEHFDLGSENKLSGLKGKWEFLAPLALASDGGNKSRIIYSRTQDGWSDDEVDAIEIEALQLSATVDSDLPVDAILSGYPIDKNGNKINGAEFEPLTIPGGAKNQSIELKLNVTPGKPVKGLDGITYKAELVASSSDALSPDQSFTLKNIQIKVSGNYTKEF